MRDSVYNIEEGKGKARMKREKKMMGRYMIIFMVNRIKKERENERMEEAKAIRKPVFLFSHLKVSKSFKVLHTTTPTLTYFVSWYGLEDTVPSHPPTTSQSP